MGTASELTWDRAALRLALTVLAGALIGLAVPGVEVDDVATTAKTIPDFVGMWTAMLAGNRTPA